MKIVDVEPIIEGLYKIGYEKDELGEHEFALGIDTVIYLLEKAKAVDAVSTADDDLVRVVRCKDCKHWVETWCRNWADWLPTDANAFCSYGEPKEGE